MKLLFLILFSCLELSNPHQERKNSSLNEDISEKENDVEIAGKSSGIKSDQNTPVSTIQNQLTPFVQTVKPQSETNPLEIILEKDTKFTNYSTAHIKVKTNEALQDSTDLVVLLGNQCLQKGCLVSVYGGSLIGPVGNKKYTYFVSVTGPHGNPWTNVSSPSLPYTLELHYPAYSLESELNSKNEQDIKFYIDYDQYSWNFRL